MPVRIRDSRGRFVGGGAGSGESSGGERNSVNREARRALSSAWAKFWLEGLGETLDKLSSILDKVTGTAAKEVFLKAGMALRDDARGRVAVKTGNLKRGIFAARGDERKPNVLVGVNYRIAPHAHLVEFGTVKMSPRPFMRPAISATSAKIKTIIADGLKKIIEDATRGRN